MMTAPAGRRRYRVTVEHYTGGEVGGQPDYADDAKWATYNTLDKVPASWEAVSGGESVRGHQMEAESTGLVVINWTPRAKGITSAMRLRLEGRKLNVVNVDDPDGNKRELYIQVTEKT